MAPTWAHESPQPYVMNQFKSDNFNICRLMAEKAMQDLEYKAQLERSIYDHDKPTELAELNIEIEKGMTALRRRHMDNEKEAWERFRLRKFFDEGLGMGTSCLKTTTDGKRSIAGLRETNLRDIESLMWTEKDESEFTGTASSSARRALTMLAANQRIQSDPHPFQLMELPAEIREQIYRALLIGGGRTIVVSGDNGLSVWSRSCKIEGASAFGKDITAALLRTNRCIYDEALPVLYQSHAFDFGIDVHNIAPFFNQTSFAARQNVQCIHMELLRYGIDRPLRSVCGQGINDNGPAWSSACAYIASHLRVKELSLNINFAIHQEFQRFRWVRDLTQIRGVRTLYHHNSPNTHGLKSTEASVLLANQMSRHDWGTDEYRWEALLEYLRSKMEQ